MVFIDSLTIFVIVCLGVFTLRRVVFSLTTVFTHVDWDLNISISELPSVTILIPCHNEESVISYTLDSLLRIEYPTEKLEIIVINDFSSDKTLEIARNYEQKYLHIHVINQDQSSGTRGKARALNKAMKRFQKGDLIYFLDADHLLRPDALSRLARHFTDPFVGAASGRSVPRNKYRSMIASYVYVESLIQHRVTMYASDRLNLAPGILGSNFCIRRSLLDRIGLFDEEALTEDIDLTFSVYDQGYIVKYDVTSITEHEAPESIQNYILQHLRWNRGFNKVARSHWWEILKNSAIPLPRRMEQLLFSMGYFDRLLFLAAFGLTVLSLFILPSYHFPLWIWVLFLGVPAFEIMAGLLAEKERASFFIKLPLIMCMFSVDIFVALKGFYQDVIKKPARWDKSPRLDDSL